MPTNNTARCPRCGETKSLDDFPRHRGRANGRGVRCRVCHAADIRAYRQTPAGKEANTRAWYRSVAKRIAEREARAT